MADADRVLRLFREWDDDQNGVISMDEFRLAIPLLGVKAAPNAYAELFASLDQVSPSESDLSALTSALRAIGSIESGGPLYR